VAELDLADPASVEAFSHWFVEGHDQLDRLINNAGVMAPPPTLNAAGIEMQWATNHLGHFALTGRLLKPLLATAGSRVVAVSSLAAAGGRILGYDPTSLVGYRRVAAYANSKLANLVFALELDRRLRATDSSSSGPTGGPSGGPTGPSTMAVAAHPGVTHTNLASSIDGGIRSRAVLGLSRLTTQSVAQGVLPILRAANDPTVEGGRYYGPSGWRQYRGAAVEIPLPASAVDPALGPELWTQSVSLSGVDYLGLPGGDP
jgi:NAD(P)-dependent dehydrogenase (short-subunit alcohol dehydrogenase family)